MAKSVQNLSRRGSKRGQLWRRAGYLLLLIALLASHSSAQVTFFEDLFGPTNIYGFSGNGGLTAAFSEKGVVTLLRYPSPSFYDQLFYMTKPKSRFAPRMGAARFAGLQFGYRKKGEKRVHLFPEEANSSAYAQEIGSVFVTKYGRKRKSEMFVLPDRDLLVLHLETDEQVTSFFYENLALVNHKLKGVPVADWLKDAKNDYGLWQPPSKNRLVRFIPRSHKEYWRKKLRRVWKEEGGKGVERALQSMSGIFAVLLADPSPEEIYTGAYDPAHDTSQAVQNFIHNQKSAHFQLGQLSSLMSFGKVRHMTLYLAFAPTLQAAEQDALWAKEQGYAALKKAHAAYWKQKLAPAILPATKNARSRAFVLRTLQTILMSRDRKSGAIVASVATQPPYSLDWPRDGAFINLLLDWAGFQREVTQHNLFYLKVQRKKGPPNRPAGSFAMNFYADGMVGGPIPFEIDETGFILWAWAEHARYLPESEQRSYLEKVYPGIRLAADTLTTCKDPVNGLQCVANENDSLDRTQGIEGAIIVTLGLSSAVRVARRLGQIEDANRWDARRKELREATLSSFYNEDRKIFPARSVNGGWVVYPVQFFSFADPRSEAQAQYVYSLLQKALLGKGPSKNSYDAVGVLSLALLWRNNEEKRAKLLPLLRELVEKVPMKGTLHVGEVYTRLKNDPSKWLNVQSPPHLWNASLISLSLYAFSPPPSLQPFLP